MKERVSLAFPYIVAAALPLAGVVMALFRVTEKKYYDAGLLLLSAMLGALIFLIALT